MVAIMDDRWIDSRARKLAFVWREPVEDCKQMLAVELLQGRIHRHAFLRVWHKLRKQAGRRCNELLEHPEHRDSSLPLEWSEFLDEVLNEKEQWCVHMRLAGIKWDIIAGVLDCSARTCQRIHTTAIEKLRIRLDESQDGSNGRGRDADM
jgi:hypothetical protein